MEQNERSRRFVSALYKGIGTGMAHKLRNGPGSAETSNIDVIIAFNKVREPKEEGYLPYDENKGLLIAKLFYDQNKNKEMEGIPVNFEKQLRRLYFYGGNSLKRQIESFIELPYSVQNADYFASKFLSLYRQLKSSGFLCKINFYSLTEDLLFWGEKVQKRWAEAICHSENENQTEEVI